MRIIRFDDIVINVDISGGLKMMRISEEVMNALTVKERNDLLVELFRGGDLVVSSGTNYVNADAYIVGLEKIKEKRAMIHEDS